MRRSGTSVVFMLNCGAEYFILVHAFPEINETGEMLYCVMNQLFTLRSIVGVNGDSHVDCVVLTFVAPSLLGNNLSRDYPSSLFGNFSYNTIYSLC